jgi:hypothetical protein
MSKENKERLWMMIRERAELILGCRVLLPPLERGTYWQQIAELLEQDCDLVNGDGTNWEAWTGMFSGIYAFAINDGCPQFATGAALTSVFGTIIVLAISPFIFGDTSKLEAIGAMGDDLVALAKKISARNIENIWEIDRIATTHRIILGMIILEDRKGTFSGLNRMSVDRGDKGFHVPLNQWFGPVKGTASTEAASVYVEIMKEGTLQGEPLIDRVALEKEVDFWEGYRKERTEMLASLPNLTVEV